MCVLASVALLMWAAEGVRAMEHDSPSLLLRLVCQHLITARVDRPGPVKLLERVAMVRVEQETYDRIAHLLTDTRRAELGLTADGGSGDWDEPAAVAGHGADESVGTVSRLSSCTSALVGRSRWPGTKRPRRAPAGGRCALPVGPPGQRGPDPGPGHRWLGRLRRHGGDPVSHSDRHSVQHVRRPGPDRLVGVGPGSCWDGPGLTGSSRTGSSTPPTPPRLPGSASQAGLNPSVAPAA